MLPNVPFDGWTIRSLRAGLAAAGLPEDEAAILFPGGAADMIAVFCDLADYRRMTEAAATLGEMPLTTRVRAIIALRLTMNRPHKEAVRRALAVLALPGNARTAARDHRSPVDAIWHAAGRPLGGFQLVQTKRALLRPSMAPPCCSG